MDDSLTTNGGSAQAPIICSTREVEVNTYGEGTPSNFYGVFASGERRGGTTHERYRQLNEMTKRRWLP